MMPALGVETDRSLEIAEDLGELTPRADRGALPTVGPVDEGQDELAALQRGRLGVALHDPFGGIQSGTVELIGERELQLGGGVGRDDREREETAEETTHDRITSRP